MRCVAYGRSAPSPLPRACQVLLTRPTSLPDAVEGALTTHVYDHALAAGGTAAVSEAVYAEVASLIPADDIERAFGADRYATAAAVADWAWRAEFGGGEFIGLATGDNFPDALSGGAACGYERGVLLLTRAGALDAGAAAFMTDHVIALRQISVFGGSGVISGQVIADCDAIAP